VVEQLRRHPDWSGPWSWAKFAQAERAKKASSCSRAQAVLADDGGEDVEAVGLVARGHSAAGGRVVVRLDAGGIEDLAGQPDQSLSSSSAPVESRVAPCQVSCWNAVCPVRGFRRARGPSSSLAT
jgi:hypothetical protein